MIAIGGGKKKGKEVERKYLNSKYLILKDGKRYRILL